MARHWLREALADRGGRVDPTEYAMALFGVRDDAERTEEVVRDLHEESPDWRGLADRQRRHGRQ